MTSSNQQKDVSPSDIWIEQLKILDQTTSEEPYDPIKRSETEWHNIRIFISSTFKDFKWERDVLIKQVFQDLRIWCQKKRLRLIDVDLRWGIPEEIESKSLSICLEEIERCRRENVRPYFLNMTCSRRGWTPKEFDEIKELYKLVNGLSVTEMEIVRGGFYQRNPNAIFLLRDGSFIKELNSETQKSFMESKESEKKMLEELKRQIRDFFDTNHVFTYKCRPHERPGTYPSLDFEPEDIFSKTVLEFFKKRISEQYPDEYFTPTKEFDKASHDQECFVEFQADGVIGRDALMEEIEIYIQGKNCSPLVVVGEAGSGKTSLMASAVKKWKDKKKYKKQKLFYHFVGAVPRSTDLLDMLRRLLLELTPIEESELPTDLKEAKSFVLGVLKKRTDSPMIIFVDAINQLDKTSDVKLDSWLPSKLGEGVRCIVSVIAGRPGENMLSSSNTLDVRTLAEEDRKKIVEDILGKHCKVLNHEEMKKLFENSGSKNPLWLSLACEELRVTGEFRKKIGKNKFEYQVLKEIKNLPTDLLGLIGKVLDRLMENDDERKDGLIKATLCLLEVSKSGLLEDELLELLAADNSPTEEDNNVDKDNREQQKPRLPAMKWCLVERALKRFLRPFGDLKEGRLHLYHSSVSQHIRERADLWKENSKKNWHQKLANYFWHCPIHYRKVEELPHHLIELKQLQKLEMFLSEWKTLEALHDPVLSTTLFTYWRKSGDTKLERMRTTYWKKLKESKQCEYGDRLIMLASLLKQAGFYDDALSLTDEALCLENESASSPVDHHERLVDIHQIKASTYSELAKAVGKSCRKQLKYLNPCIEQCTKSIESLQVLLGMKETREKQIKLAKLKLLLAFSLGQKDQIVPEKKLNEQCKKSVEETKQILEKVGDFGLLAEAIMTEGIFYWRREERMKQPKIYEQAWECCTEVYGKYHPLSARIKHNLGVAYEDMGKKKEAYEHYKESFLIKHEIYGPTHRLTTMALEILELRCFRQFFKCDDDIPK